MSGVIKKILPMPEAPPPPEAPVSPDTGSAAAVQAAGEAARRRQRKASGRASTMLSGQGSAYQAPTVGTAKLLGG